MRCPYCDNYHVRRRLRDKSLICPGCLKVLWPSLRKTLRGLCMEKMQNRDYGELLARVQRVLHRDWVPPFSQDQLLVLIQDAKEMYFPEKCPKCEKPYPQEDPRMYLVKDPKTQFCCLTCLTNVFTESIKEAFKTD
jgi:hypothetical protein